MKNANILENNTAYESTITAKCAAIDAEKREKVAKTAHTTTFSELLKTYNKEATKALATNNPNYPPYVDALQALSKACACSVLATCIDPTRKSGKTTKSSENSTGTAQNPYLLEMKRDIARDTANLATLQEISNFLDTLTYKKDGSICNVARDKMGAADVDALDTINRLATDILGDGMDLVQSATLCLLEQSQKSYENNGFVDLEAIYTVTELSKRVYIKKDESAAWRDRDTCGIRECYRGVRRMVANSRAIQLDPRSGYSYLQDFATDDDGNTIEDMAIYRRLPHFADFGGYGSNGLYTVDDENVHEINEIVDKLELSKVEDDHLRLRFAGAGYKAIATYTGRSENAAKKTGKRIEVKATKIGLTTESYEKAKKARKNAISDLVLLEFWQGAIPAPVPVNACNPYLSPIATAAGDDYTASVYDKTAAGDDYTASVYAPKWAAAVAWSDTPVKSAPITIARDASNDYMGAMHNFYAVWMSTKK